MLTGLICAVALSAINLVTGDYVYGALGRLLLLGTDFVPFTLALYLFGLAIGGAAYAAARHQRLRDVFRRPVEWIPAVFGVSCFVYGGLVVLDLLFDQVFPRFELPGLAITFFVLLSLFNCLLFSVAAAGLLFEALVWGLPLGADDPRNLSVLFAFLAVALVIGVFLSNDLRVEDAKIQPRAVSTESTEKPVIGTSTVTTDPVDTRAERSSANLESPAGRNSRP